MFRFRLQMWQMPRCLLMCLAGLLLNDICRSQHLVKIQEGPLHRVKGYPTSISCIVSGYSGHADQGFAFSVYKQDHPDREIKIISTFDKNYAYAVYSQRVRNKNLVIERLSKTSVLFHFTSLLAEDAGIYECYTPNQFTKYEGTYNAKTSLNVIEDTLKASYSGPLSHTISEGESLQLECEVFSQTMQHTHLSVTWYLRGSSETIPIITLDRTLTVKPGAAFEPQYRSGLISMEKVEDTTYRLKMSQVQQSASGDIYCQAEEWIQDPDRSWIKIAHKNTTGSHVVIKALDIVDVGSFSVDIDVVSGTLQEGEKAVIRCNVLAQNLPGHFFSITWLKNNMEVVHIGPSGVQSVASGYEQRENEWELRAVKVSDKAYVLTIQHVRAEDQGQYQCKATQEIRTETGDFTRGKSQTSSEKVLRIEAKASGLAVVMSKEQVDVTEGETLKLTCGVSGASGPLSVSWQHKKTSGSSYKDVINLSSEGVMMGGTGPQYQDRIVRTFHSTANFTLEISDTILSDSGEYKCAVSEWNIDSSGSKKEVNSQSQQTPVSVKSIDSLLKLVLNSRTTSVTEDSVIKMLCSVRGPIVPLEVHWKFQPNSTATQKDVICMLRNGAISCGSEQRDYQVEAQVRESNTVFFLTVLRASKKHQGLYQCQVTAYQGMIQKSQKNSNLLAVSVRSPVFRLSLSISPKSSVNVPVKSNAKLDCIVSGVVSNFSRFAVTWMSGPQILATMDTEGVVILGPSANQEMDPRINMRMTKRQTFQLTIQEVRSTDSGQYHCSVEEWIQDPDGIWYLLNGTSVTTELAVIEKDNGFSLDKPDEQLVVTEGEQVDLKCSLLSNEQDSTYRYSLTWFFESQDQKKPTIQLLTYNHDGRLQFQDHDVNLQHRLYFSRPTVSAFHLSILNSNSFDSGRYRCQVDQYQLDCNGRWEWKAGSKSDFTSVSVRFIESKLQVQKVNRSLSITDRHAGFTVDCEITSCSSNESVFEVIWFKSQGAGPMTILTVKNDGILHKPISERGLLYHHPRPMFYSLTVPDVDMFDNGQYQCQVVEWLQTAPNNWRKVAEDKSGELYVHVVSEEKPSTRPFAVENPNKYLDLTEGESFELTCSILVDNLEPTFHYTLTWLRIAASNPKTQLLRYSHDGRLQYQSEDKQLASRLLFSRPTVTTFHLTVFNSLPADSGSYECMVEQYQISESTWERKGMERTAPTIVTVQTIESKLQVQKMSRSLNVTDRHAGFKVECEITSHSSTKSVFEVTWSKGQGEEQPTTIFTVKRDGTLYYPTDNSSLFYSHPTPTHYSLTVLDVDTSHNGQYQCQVVEWLLTAPNTWRKVAEDISGQLSVHVHVYAPFEVATSCHSGTILGTIIPVLLFLLLVIVLLMILHWKTKASSKKQNGVLWAENNPLKHFPEPGEEDKA
ncbi:immunoglobulin superfamily member 2 [Hoplias malabaricus]|uniref:immunoglobulin superfamily member 2 n=1 Tax=Hoplias malabaricus TaxID=27720 RepID=UPI003461A55B